MCFRKVSRDLPHPFFSLFLAPLSLTVSLKFYLTPSARPSSRPLSHPLSHPFSRPLSHPFSAVSQVGFETLNALKQCCDELGYGRAEVLHRRRRSLT